MTKSVFLALFTAFAITDGSLCVLAADQALYETHCLACHGLQGGGRNQTPRSCAASTKAEPTRPWGCGNGFCPQRRPAM